MVEVWQEGAHPTRIIIGQRQVKGPTGPGDKNRFRPIHLQHMEEQTEVEEVGNLEVYMNLNSLEIAEGSSTTRSTPITSLTSVLLKPTRCSSSSLWPPCRHIGCHRYRPTSGGNSASPSSARATASPRRRMTLARSRMTSPR